MDGLPNQNRLNIYKLGATSPQSSSWATVVSLDQLFFTNALRVRIISYKILSRRDTFHCRCGPISQKFFAIRFFCFRWQRRGRKSLPGPTGIWGNTCETRFAVKGVSMSPWERMQCSTKQKGGIWPDGSDVVSCRGGRIIHSWPVHPWGLFRQYPFN